MIDHLLAFPNEATARVQAAAFGLFDEAGAWHWHGSHVLKVRAYVPGEFVTGDDGTVTVVRPDADVPGFRSWVALPEYDATLPGLEIACDRDAMQRGDPWLLFSAVPAERMAAVRLTPMYAGAAYRFDGAAP
jgi:hypothetical protein